MFALRRHRWTLLTMIFIIFFSIEKNYEIIIKNLHVYFYSGKF